MHPQPSVSIVVSAASAAKTLPDALRAIEAQDYQGDIEVVVAVADEPTATAAGGHDVVVVENPTGSTPAGLNLAVKESTGEVLIRVDAHAVIPPSYVRRVVDTLAATDADNVGGRQIPEGTSLLERAIAGAMSSPFGAGDATYRIGGAAGPTDTVYLGAFRRSVFEKMNGYDERYLRHQDYELNHRIREAGGTVWFDPTLGVVYRPRPSLASLASQYFQYGGWKRFFARSHRGALRPRQLAPPLLVVALAGSLIGSIWWPWLLALPASYLLGLLAAGIVSIPRVGAPAALMPVVLAVMHLSWGVGFLVGQTSDR